VTQSISTERGLIRAVILKGKGGTEKKKMYQQEREARRSCQPLSGEGKKTLHGGGGQRNELMGPQKWDLERIHLRSQKNKPGREPRGLRPSGVGPDKGKKDTTPVSKEQGLEGVGKTQRKEARAARKAHRR